MSPIRPRRYPRTDAGCGGPGALARARPGRRTYPRSPVVAIRRVGRDPWRFQGRGDPAPGLHPAEAAGAPPSPPAAPADFVALTLDLPARTPGCTLVLSHPAGPCLRLEWPQPLASEVAAVARSLWEAVA